MVTPTMNQWRVEVKFIFVMIAALTLCTASWAQGGRTKVTIKASVDITSVFLHRLDGLPSAAQGRDETSARADLGRDSRR